MNKFIATASAVAIVAAMAIPASAADVNGGSTKDTSFGPMAFAEGGTVNWSGFYVGVQGGYGNANHNLTVRGHADDTSDVQECDGDETEGPCAGQEEGAIVGLVHGPSVPLLNADGMNSAGFIGGARVGYDYSRGRFLAGVFGEYNFASMDSNVSSPLLPGIAFGLEKEDEWSIGGRVGYIAAPRTLLYILAAYTQTEYSVNGLDAVGAMLSATEGGSFSTGGTFDGISVGGGVEFALTSNIFLGLEYTHTFYGEEDILRAHVDGGGFNIGDELDEDKVMVTLKAKLGFGQ